MAQAPGPTTIKFDGTNPDQVLDYLRTSLPANPPVKGGANLQAPAPGMPRQVFAQLADGTLVTINEGDTVTASPIAITGTTVPIVPPPPKVGL